MNKKEASKLFIKVFFAAAGLSVMAIGLLFFWLAGLASILYLADSGAVIAFTMLGIRIGFWAGLPIGVYAGWWFVKEEAW